MFQSQCQEKDLPQSCGCTQQVPSRFAGIKTRLDTDKGIQADAKAACGDAGKSTSGQSAEQAAAAAASAEGQEASLVRAPVKHVLSQELQLYFDRVALLLRAQSGLCPTLVGPTPIPSNPSLNPLPPSFPPSASSFLPPPPPSTPSLLLPLPLPLPASLCPPLLSFPLSLSPSTPRASSLPCWHLC